MPKVEKLNSPHRFAANTYLVFSGGELAVVDPTVPFSDTALPVAPKYVLLTHAHFDHILEVDSWKAAGAEVVISKTESGALRDSYRNCYRQFYGSDDGYFGEVNTVDDSDTLFLGELAIRVMSVPGHTSGSVVYTIANAAFVGDTVFEGGGYGRWDLPTGDYKELVSSIEKVMTLPEDTVLYPGHGAQTTLREFKNCYKYKRLL